METTLRLRIERYVARGLFFAIVGILLAITLTYLWGLLLFAGAYGLLTEIHWEKL